MGDKVFEYSRTSAQQAKIFLRISIMMLVYCGIFQWVTLKGVIDLPGRDSLIISLALGASGVVAFIVFLFMRRRKKTFSAFVTKEIVSIDYPDVPEWSFEIPINDIKAFGYRRISGSGGSMSADAGIYTNDGRFHHVSMNYQMSVGKLYKAVKSVRPEIPFPKRVNPHKRW